MLCHGFVLAFFFFFFLVVCSRVVLLLFFFYLNDFRGWKKEGNVLFKDTLNTFYLQLYCVEHMIKDL